MSAPTRLQRGARALDAVRVRPGEWAHYDDATRRWYLVSADAVRQYADMLDADPDAYSHWCNRTVSAEQPEGWRP